MKRIFEEPVPIEVVDARHRELVDRVRAQLALEAIASDGMPAVVVPSEVTSQAAARLSVLASLQIRG